MALAGTGAGSAQPEVSPQPSRGSVLSHLPSCKPLAVLAEPQLQLLSTARTPALGRTISTDQQALSQVTGQKILSNYYVETPFSIVSVVWLPITNIIQQQKRFLVNFIFIDFFGGQIRSYKSPSVHIYLYIAFSIGKTYIKGGETFLKCPLPYSTERDF